MQDFHNLRVWNEANSLAIAIKRLTSRFPKADYGALRKQMVRAAESIADNIAEGCGAATNAEFARYLDMAITSSSELENQIERTHRYRLTRDPDHQRLAGPVCDVRKMTIGGCERRCSPLPRAGHGRRRMTNTERRTTGRKARNEQRMTDRIPRQAQPRW